MPEITLPTKVQNKTSSNDIGNANNPTNDGKSNNRSHFQNNNDDTSANISTNKDSFAPNVVDIGNSNISNSNQDSTSSKRMSQSERIKMIDDVFISVLGRSPDSRDLNFFKYSAHTYSDIQEELLNGKEHQKLIKEGRDYGQLQNRFQDLELRVKELEGRSQDQISEYRHLSELLKEKNTLIQQLRAQVSDPYSFSGIQGKEATDQEPVIQETTSQNSIQGHQARVGVIDQNEEGSSNLTSSPNDLTVSESEKGSNSHISNGRKIVPPTNYLDVEQDEKEKNLDHNESVEIKSSQFQDEIQNGDQEVDQSGQTISSDVEENQSNSSQVGDGSESDIDKDEYVGFFDGSLDNAFKVLTKSNQESEDEGSMDNVPTDPYQSVADRNSSKQADSTPQRSIPTTNIKEEVLNREAYSSLDLEDGVNGNQELSVETKAEVVDNSISSEKNTVEKFQPDNEPQYSNYNQNYYDNIQGTTSEPIIESPTNIDQPEMVFSSPTFNGTLPKIEDKPKSSNKVLGLIDKIVDRYSP